jgi:hypothetical protein
MNAAAAFTSPIPVSRPGPAVWLRGAHGGSGVSTLCRYLDFVGDSAQQWPCGNDVEVESPYVVLVARESDAGLRQAHAQIVAHYDKNIACELLGLITVAGSPTLDKSVRQYRDIVTTAVVEGGGNHWRIGWHKFLAAADLGALPRWHPLDGVPELSTRGRASVPPDVLTAGIGIVTAVQRRLPHLRTQH